MEVDQFDELMRARPFEPFTVHVAEAQAFHVPHPEFAWRTPQGGTLFVATDSGRAAHIIRMEHVTRLEPETRAGANGKASKGKRKKK